MGTELNYVVSVGAVLSDDLRAMSITQSELADRIGVSRSIISEIVNGKRKMSLDIAIALEGIFGTDASFWMNLQNQYEIMQKKSGKYLISKDIVIKTGTNSAQDIAAWFINRAAQDVKDNNGEYMTNLKLQKLLYLAQKMAVKKRQKALFLDEIRHWKFGPVVKTVYEQYKSKGADPIKSADTHKLSDDDIVILENVYKRFNKYSASGLVSITHDDIAWKNTEELEIITLESIYNS